MVILGSKLNSSDCFWRESPIIANSFYKHDPWHTFSSREKFFTQTRLLLNGLVIVQTETRSKFEEFKLQMTTEQLEKLKDLWFTVDRVHRMMICELMVDQVMIDRMMVQLTRQKIVEVIDQIVAEQIVVDQIVVQKIVGVRQGGLPFAGAICSEIWADVRTNVWTDIRAGVWHQIRVVAVDQIRIRRLD